MLLSWPEKFREVLLVVPVAEVAGDRRKKWLCCRPTSPAGSSTSTDDPGEYSGENEIDDLLYGKDDVKGISDFICKQDLVAVDDYMKIRRERQASLAHCFPFLELISF
ncbi:hypothetical protein ACLB2K_075897 [Fragaria x ananassa]